jgi:phosphate transport system substrate-binding protein
MQFCGFTMYGGKDKMKFNKTSMRSAVILAICSWCSCANNQSVNNNNARFTGNDAPIAVDESLQPVVDQELYIFKSADDKKAHPKVIYAPENGVFNLLLADSVRFAMTARDLSKSEYAALAAHNLHPIVSRFAVDAIAVIVNKASADTSITVSDLKKMLNGQGPAGKNLIFDNPNSGLVRYLKAFSGSDLKGKNIFSLKSNKEVITYVSQHPDAIGVTGFSWLNDPDKDYAAAVDNVKVLSVKDDSGASKFDGYYTPSQTTLALNQYPLTRNLYIINSTGFRSMGKKFADLVEGERGQLIILRSGLLPNDIPGRQINIVK